jgi:Flp pilus assembly protein TadD
VQFRFPIRPPFAVLTYFPVTRRPSLCAVFLMLLAAAAFAQDSREQQLEHAFQSAVSQYEAGHFAEAASQLQSLVRDLPQSFDVEELLGLVYSAQSQDGKATEHLQKAVHLKPDSAAARTNLATNLMHLGKPALAEAQFRKAVDLEPKNFDANHNLGEFYVQAGKLAQAAPYLEQAQQINRSSYENGYDLTLAYLQLGKLPEARTTAQALLQQKDGAELHNLLGQIEEQDGKYVEAVNQFELAAHAEPSESNLFDWGSELLLHRTLDPAVQVFQQAAERYPTSPRLLIGLGMALYSRANYDEAVKALLKAADLNPGDPRCYLFLSRAYDSSPAQAEDVIQRFQRFATLQPKNPRALYYYAMSLWKGRRLQDANVDFHQIESLLKASASLDSQFPEPHLQLGNLYSDQGKYADAIPEYRQALAQNATFGDAHYRLGQAYVRTGRKDLAQPEFDLYQQLRSQHLADLDKQRAEIRQFVYSEKETGAVRQ